jgi:hypothetical protein
VLVSSRFIAQFGGMIEAFRGWGGEDNGFAAKLERLGRAGVTQSPVQQVYHLYHELSALDRAAAAAANPHHSENVALLARVRSLRTAEHFCAAFPRGSDSLQPIVPASAGLTTASKSIDGSRISAE